MFYSGYEAMVLTRQRAQEGVRRTQRALALGPSARDALRKGRTGLGVGFARLVLVLRELMGDRGRMARVTRPREASPRA